MSNLFAKTGLLIAMLFLCIITTNAQDFIIKNDKTEIKSKVAEFTETTINYKKWENQDETIYYIALNEVFMIIYANGQREIIKQPENSSPITTVIINEATRPINNVEKSLYGQKGQTNKIDKNTPAIYYSYRINIALQSPFTIGFDGDQDCEKYTIY